MAYKFERWCALFVFSWLLLLGACSSSNKSTSAPSSPSSSALEIETASLASGTVGVAYSATLVAQGGASPYQWSVTSGAVPAGLALDSATGQITGTPSAAEDEPINIQVTDGAGQTAEKTLTLSVQPHSTGPTYYIDSQSGDDSNDGMSQDAPWRTIAKVNSSQFSPGDTILFKRGDVWREVLQFSSSGESGNPILIDAYGAGSLPVISGADLVPPSAWSLCETCAPAIWKTAVTTGPNVVTLNGVKGNRQQQPSSLANPGDWSWASGVLYLHSQGNPATAYGNPGVEVGNRGVGINLSGASFVTVQNLQISGADGPYSDGAVFAETQASQNPHDLVLNQLTVLNGAGDGVHLEDCQNCVVENLTVSGMAHDGILLMSRYNSFSITSGFIQGNTVSSAQRNGISTYGCPVGAYQEQCPIVPQPNGIFLTGVTISGNAVYDNGAGIYLHWTNSSTVSANSAYNNTNTSAGGEGGGINMEASSNNLVSKNLAYGNRLCGVCFSDDALPNAGSTVTGASSNVVSYNAIHDNGGQGLQTNTAPSENNQFLYNVVWRNASCFQADGTGHRVIGNTCYLNTVGIDLYTSSTTPTTGSITVENNIVAASTNAAVAIGPGVSLSTLNFDNNAYSSDSDTQFNWPGFSSDFDFWRSESGQDAHSFVANPEFVSAAASSANDLSVQPNSPVNGAGANLGPSVATGLAPGSVWPGNVSTQTQASQWSIGAFIGGP